MPKTNNKPFVIGVAGGSGSGKSTVTREVLASIGPEMASVVYQDDYYLDQTHLSIEERVKTNYDHPDALEERRVDEDAGAVAGLGAAERREGVARGARHRLLHQRVRHEAAIVPNASSGRKAKMGLGMTPAGPG